MRKTAVMIAATMLLCLATFSAQAAQKISIDMTKESALMHDISSADISVYPEDMVQVTRHSLWPWDEAGTKWSMFVEIENISGEKIVIDENRLAACKTNRKEIASADYVFACSDNVMDPGEKIVMYAGAYPYPIDKRNNGDVSLDVWDVEGMEDFADSIRRAKLLCVRLDTRGEESSQNWRDMEIEPKIWIDENTLYFEWTNETGEPVDFHTIGAIVSDEQGHIMDVICMPHSRGAAAAPGEALTFQKQLSPYIGEVMKSGAVFEAFAYQMGGK